MLYEYLVFMFLCGLITGIIGSNKGRSGFLWFVIGFLLAPLGIVLALVIKKDNQTLESKAIALGTQKKCPFCAELIKAEAVICKHCNRDQTEHNTSMQRGNSQKALLSAIADNDIEAVRSILNSVKNISYEDFSTPPLEYAELHGNEEIISLIKKAF
ncbi:hypothetical protein [Pseudoalteromonas sp. CAL260-MNA-CIBAN-0059]|uniref:hypothetical protein n=1 Tax=Pseudoalteromonas sp. CAL260-MNA-CIBAN-0059 TaxID=3140430 RepID=UPI00332AFFD9|tara:strand:+ start:7532 stop:8002 length:471 start_codon:yes stop_codon:yes gene_type:complete